MHDGSYRTLNDVLDSYQRGGSGHWNQDPLIEKIVFSNEEKEDLLAFLKTLTDDSFLTNESFRK